MPPEFRTLLQQGRLFVHEAFGNLRMMIEADATNARGASSDLTQLEERILMSASPIAMPPDAGGGVEPTELDNSLNAESLDGSPLGPTADQSTDDAHTRLEVIFVDASVEDREKLLALEGLRTDAHVRFQLYEIANDEDGVERISEVLAGLDQVASLHVVAHGNDGSLQLGTAVLDQSSLPAYAAQITGWQDALTADADLLFYGCDLAATAAGRDFVDQLGALAQADVAASDDVTGHVSLGGDWDFEYLFGTFDSQVAYSTSTQAHWLGTLQTVVVTTTDDVIDAADLSTIDALLADPGADGVVSLREAVIATNNTGGTDEILLGVGIFGRSIGGKDDLSAKGDLDIQGDLVIRGASTRDTIIDAEFKDRVFDIAAGVELSLSDLTVTRGFVAGEDGGGIRMDGGRLVLNRVWVEGNEANKDGGAIFNNGGEIDFTDVMLRNNLAYDKGGAIFNAGTASLVNVTIAGNQADKGGGINHEGGGSLLTMVNVTISGNDSWSEGGGLLASRPVTATNVTIANNTSGKDGAGVDIHGANGSLTLYNSILSNNLAAGVAANAEGPVTSLGFNIDDDGTAGLTQGTDLSNVDPLLDVLADNGGFVQTHALLAGSVAIDLGGTAGPALDARHQGRNGIADIGAYESDFTPSVLFWSDRTDNVLRRSHADGSGYQTIVTGLNDPVGVAVDLSGGKIYWADSAAKTVNRANLDGTGQEVLYTVSGSTRAPYGMDVDPQNGKLYVVVIDTSFVTPSPRVVVSNLDGSGQINLPIADLGTPGDIVVDEASGQIFWTDYFGKRIQAARLDGSNVTTISSGFTHGPVAIDIDKSNGLLYWTTSPFPSGTGSLYRANLDGSNRQILTEPINSSKGITIDDDGDMIWSEADRIRRFDTTTTNFSDLAASQNGPFDVEVASLNTNRRPTVNDESYVVDKNTPLTVNVAAGVLANDSDPDGDSLTIVSASALFGSIVMQPDGSFTYTPKADFVGTDVVLYKVSDSQGSFDFGNAYFDVQYTNDAPELDATSAFALTNVVAGNTKPAGNTVASLLQSRPGAASDNDGDPLGIAVVAVDDQFGIWEYSLDGSNTWTSFAASGVSDDGTPEPTQAVLLDANARVRFVPNGGYVGNAGNLAFVAWDQSQGVNGNTNVDTSYTLDGAFSAVVGEATLEVESPWGVDVDVPAGGPIMLDAGTSTSFSVAGANPITVSDGTPANALLRLELTVQHGTLTLAGTAGITFETGAATSAQMIIIGTESALNAALDGLSYQPGAGYTGGDQLDLTVDVHANRVGRFEFDSAGTLGVDAEGNLDAAVDASVVAIADANRGPVVRLDGTNSLVIPSDFGQPPSITVATWMRLNTANDAGRNIVTIGDGVKLEVGPDGKLAGIVRDGATQLIMSNQSLVGMGWHHVAFAVDTTSSTMTLYIDGIEVARGAYSGTINYASGTTVMGATSPGLPTGMIGRLDDLMVYTRALAQSEVREVFLGASEDFASVSFEVIGRPQVVDDAFDVPVGGSLNLDILGNDVPLDAGLDITSGQIVAGPAHGTVTWEADGTITYTHDGSTQLSDSFSYTVADMDGDVSFTATVTLTMLTQAPTDILLSNATIDENTDTTGGTNVGVLSAVDSDLVDAHNWSIVGGADAGLFQIDAGTGDTLVIDAGLIDFEAQATYEVVVRAIDAYGNVCDKSLTISVNDMNEAPALTLTNVVGTLAEGTDTSTALRVADLVISDDGLGTNGLGLSGADAAVFEIVGNQLRLRAGTVLDFETQSSYAVDVVVTDTVTGLGDTASYLLTVSDVNEAPALTLTNVVGTLAEGTDTSTALRVADLVISDDGLGTNGLGLSGADAAVFEIVGNQLRLRAGTVLDFETQSSYAVDVVVTDTVTGLGDTASYLLTVSDVNEAPALTLTNVVGTLAEGTDTSTALRVADLVISDDGLGTNGLGLGGADAAVFEIVGNQLRLRAGTVLDFETQSSYAVDVVVTDTVTGLGDTASYLLTVSDVNEAPALTLTNIVGTLAEGTDTSTALRVADLVISDDGLGTNGLGLGGADAAVFEIVGNQLRLRAGTVLDFETQSSYAVDVVVTDTVTGLGDTASYLLTVGDANEAPFVRGTNKLTLVEDAAETIVDLTSWFGDPDGSDGDLTYQIKEDHTAGLFKKLAVDQQANTLKLTLQPDRNGSGTVVISATDAAGLAVEKSITIDVTPANDTVRINDQSVTVFGSDPVRGPIISQSVDADGEALTVQLVNAPSHGRVTLRADGTYEFIPDAGFTGTDSFSVLVDDGVSPSNVATIQLAIQAFSLPLLPTTADATAETSPKPTSDTASDQDAINLLGVVAPTSSENDDDLEGYVPQRRHTNEAFDRESGSGDLMLVMERQAAELDAIRELTDATGTRPDVLSYATVSIVTLNSFSNQTASEVFAAIMGPGDMWHELDAFQDAMGTKLSMEEMVVGSIGTLSSSLVVGYVIWVVRSGLLLSSVVASMPAWTLIDPTVIMTVSDGDDEEDGESLADIVQDAQTNDAAAQAVHS